MIKYVTILGGSLQLYNFSEATSERKYSQREEAIEGTSRAMEASQSAPLDNRDRNPNPNLTSIAAVGPVWPTVDGPLGLSEEDAVSYARRFYKFGFALLPFLWAVNCFYFWPVLRHKRSFPQIRRYVLGSAIGFTAFMIVMCSWALTFAIGGESLFGAAWNKLVMYNLADKWGLTGWD